MTQQLEQLKKCDVKSCKNNAVLRCTYDSDEEIDQVIQVCKSCYDSYDIMPDGEKFEYFKKFTKNIEVIIHE